MRCVTTPHKEEPRKDTGYTHPAGTLRGFFFEAPKPTGAIVGIWPLEQTSIQSVGKRICPPIRTTSDRCSGDQLGPGRSRWRWSGCAPEGRGGLLAYVLSGVQVIDTSSIDVNLDSPLIQFQ